MSTNQMVVARIDHQRFIVKVHPDFDSAMAHWQVLDTALREGRLVVLSGSAYRNIESGRVIEDPSIRSDYLAIRDSDDTQWNRQPRIRLGAVRKGRGTTRADDLYQRIAREAGFHGHAGGWLYRGGPGGNSNHHRAGTRTSTGEQGCRLTGYQGWNSYWYHRGEVGLIVVIDHRFHRLEVAS